MYIIAAADRNWAIGKNGGLLYHLPKDMKFFRETTQNSIVIMGRKTLESFPGGKPLKNRINIVFTRNNYYKRDGVLTCHNTDELTELLKRYPDKKAFVIGGSQIYELLLPLCNGAYITRIDAEADADSFLPDLDTLPNWNKVKISDEFSDNGISFRFVLYEKS